MRTAMERAAVAFGVAAVLAACGSKTPATSGTGPGSGSAIAPVDAAPDQPLVCTSDDDCILVHPSVVSCPGACGFCPGEVAVLKGTPAIKCPPPVDYSKADPTMPLPDPPNCAACEEPPVVRAACREQACVTVPR